MLEILKDITPLYHRPGGTPPHWKNKPKIRPYWKTTPQIASHWEKWSTTIPTVDFWSRFAVPTGFLGLKTMKTNIPTYKIKEFLIPSGKFALNFISPLAIKLPPGH